MPDIGSTLREARMRERIDITEVEAQTKIRAKYLRAIENEEWDLLPGAVYAKSFLRTYGDYLGLDSRMLVDEFRRRHERVSEQDIRPVSSRPRRDRDRDRHAPPRRVPGWLPIAVVVVAVVAILYAVGRWLPGSTTTTNTQRAGIHHHRHHVQSVLPKTTATTPPPPRKATVRMVPTNAVYVCLVNGAGTKLINEQTFNVGETIPTETGSRLLLTLGNNNVQLRVNGKLWPVAPSSTAIRLLITPTAVRHISLAVQPTCP